MRRASLNRAGSLCVGVLLLAAVASGLVVGSKGEAAVAHPTPSPATSNVPLTATGQPEIYFVPDVVEQFDGLALRPDGLAFGIGSSPDATTSKHYQGMARTHGPGPQYLFVSRSGNDSICSWCADDSGNLLIVRMGSRDESGERFRTNRLIRDWVPHVRDANGEPVRDDHGRLITWTKPPDPRDTTVADIAFNGRNGWPSYGHPGGMQLVGDVLALALEHPYNEGDSANLILFLDVSNPETPVLLSGFQPLPSSDYKAGLVGLTPVRNPLGAGVRYLMITTGDDSHEVRFYRSLPTDPDGSTNLKSPNLYWESLRSISSDQIESCSGGLEWPDGSGAHQSLNFVRQESLDGPLFLVAARNTFLGGPGTDFLDLYEVKVDPYGNPEGCPLKRRRSTHVTSYPYNGHGDSANLAAATGTYVSPSGELIFYGTEYENDGPFELKEDGSAGRRTVRFGEWRHRDMVRRDSPTLRPTVEVDGSFEVDEGSVAILAGKGKAPLTKAWIQLFEDDNAGASLPPPVRDRDAWMAVDYDDWGKDNFDDFSQYDARTDTNFNNNAGSWRWFAPTGCTLRANQDQFYATTGTFPGSQSTTLYGEGRVFEDTDLDNNAPSMDDVISSVQFFPTAEVKYPFPDCRAYYNAPISVAWDLDINGVFETAGQNPAFSAAELDGPDVRAVHARAQHPTDTTRLGPGATVAVNIRVRNVAPRVAGLDLVDSLGFKVGGEVPFALVNLEYAAEGSFTDPGKPDHQTAALNFGEGATIPHNALDLFGDAFGGVTGRLRQRHTYRTPGTYMIRLEVADDDGGQTAAEMTVRVVSPVEAIESVIEQIDLLLATTTDAEVMRELRHARDKLDGNHIGDSTNGALDKLAKGELTPALVKIKEAIDALEHAEAEGGGDLNGLKYFLALTGEAIAQGAYLEALARVGSPSPAEAEQLQRIRESITRGHGYIGARDYPVAVEEFKHAVSHATSLG